MGFCLGMCSALGQRRRARIITLAAGRPALISPVLSRIFLRADQRAAVQRRNGQCLSIEMRIGH
jgi:hypothetical protein